MVLIKITLCLTGFKILRNIFFLEIKNYKTTDKRIA